MMTVEQQVACFDCTLTELDTLMRSLKQRHESPVMPVMSLLSDVQAMTELGLDKETIRRTLNRAKYILDQWGT